MSGDGSAEGGWMYATRFDCVFFDLELTALKVCVQEKASHLYRGWRSSASHIP